jgi:anti-sigma-K factor RskA
MNVHDQFADDLALYALGILSAEERDTLAEHLHGCAECRRELECLRGDMALMALSAAGPKPPVRARQRLLGTLAQEPRSHPLSARRTWWAPIPWFAAALLAFVAIFFWRQSRNLARDLAQLQRESRQQQAELERAREVVATLTAPDAQIITVTRAHTRPQPQGKAIYIRDRASLIFLASNLPALPPHKAYQLWLIPPSGLPIPAGVFKPDANGSATMINPPLPLGVQAKAFAMTIEPEQGSSTPTMPIVMMGAGE